MDKKAAEYQLYSTFLIFWATDSERNMACWEQCHSSISSHIDKLTRTMLLYATQNNGILLLIYSTLALFLLYNICVWWNKISETILDEIINMINHYPLLEPWTTKKIHSHWFQSWHFFSIWIRLSVSVVTTKTPLFKSFHCRSTHNLRFLMPNIKYDNSSGGDLWLKHTTALLALSDHYILCREWRVIVRSSTHQLSW